VLKDNAGVAMDPALLGPAGPAMLEVWFPGQEDGHIVADLLFGVANPSGKLPVTFPRTGQGFMDWVKTDSSVYPGVKNAAGQPAVNYKEGLDIGYRWYDANAVAPAFSFGHGLSYTSFAISKLEITPKVSDGTHPILVQFFVENTGKTYGAEVPQVYVGLPSSLGEPPKRLVAFDKVWLEPGEKTKVKISIDPSANSHPLGTWNSGAQSWVVADGNYQFFVGNSAANIAFSDSVTVRTPAGR